MKILIVHNFSQSSSPSGEDVVFRDEVKLLGSTGIDVVSYERSNDEISRLSSWKAAVSTAWARRTYDEISDLIRCTIPAGSLKFLPYYLFNPLIMLFRKSPR